MALAAKELCAAFRDRAAAVHELISYSYAHGVGVSEETITDVTLVEMRRRLHPHVIAQKFTKHEEASVSGADWLWTIGRPGRWLSLLIQAKLARPGAVSLAGLHHGKGAQRQTLVAHALQRNYLPLYVVYSSFGDTPALPAPPTGAKGRRRPTAPSWTPNCTMALEDIKQMGCVAVRPRQVALMFRGKGQKENIVRLLNGGRPWACLFCCPSRSGQTELADAVAAGLTSLPIDSPAPVSPGGAKTSEPDDSFESPEHLIASQPPDVVAELLEGRTPDHVPFSQVVVVSAEPIALHPQQTGA